MSAKIIVFESKRPVELDVDFTQSVQMWCTFLFLTFQQGKVPFICLIKKQRGADK